MGKSRKLWINWWKSAGVSSGLGREKAVQKSFCFKKACSGWWESVRFCGLLFGFSGESCGKVKRGELGSFSWNSEIST